MVLESNRVSWLVVTAVIDLQMSIEESLLRVVSDPDILIFSGPFLTTVLNKLDNMMNNSLAVNLLLTELIVRLASYPHTLLRSFLLNHHLVFQPTIKSLLQVTTEGLRGQNLMVNSSTTLKTDTPTIINISSFFIRYSHQSSIKLMLMP